MNQNVATIAIHSLGNNSLYTKHLHVAIKSQKPIRIADKHIKQKFQPVAKKYIGRSKEIIK